MSEIGLPSSGTFFVQNLRTKRKGHIRMIGQLESGWDKDKFAPADGYGTWYVDGQPYAVGQHSWKTGDEILFLDHPLSPSTTTAVGPESSTSTAISETTESTTTTPGTQIATT